jgi:DNA-binding transcriptional LysR family regulator
MEWPFASPSRIPPRVLDPLLAAQREGAARTGVTRPFPAIECNGLEPLKRMVATSDLVTATILPCIADELGQGTLQLLATEPWMYLHYGIVSLRGRPWTQLAETMRDMVLEEEQAATELGHRLFERHGPQQLRKRNQARMAKARKTR